MLKIQLCITGINDILKCTIENSFIFCNNTLLKIKVLHDAIEEPSCLNLERRRFFRL